MAVDLHPSPRRSGVSCCSSQLKSDSQPCSGLVFLGTSHAQTLTENCCLHPSFSLSQSSPHPPPFFLICSKENASPVLSHQVFFGRNLIGPHILITFKHLQMQFENKAAQTFAGGFAVSRSRFFFFISTVEPCEIFPHSLPAVILMRSIILIQDPKENTVH